MRRRHALVPSLAVLCTTALAACAPGGTAPGSEPVEPTAVSTILGTEEVTLSLMSTPESGEATKKAIAAFEGLNPNVTIEYEQTNYEDYNKSLNLALSSSTAPDIVLLNSVGTTVKNGLVRNLDGYAQAYGWDEEVPTNQLAQWQVDTDGTTLGLGPLYAAPAGFSIVGVYYNKALAAQIGLDAPPASLEELTAAMGDAQAAGILPLQLGNAEGHAAFPVQLVAQAVDGPAEYSAWVYGQSGATFDTPGNAEGLDLLADWATDGFIPDDANGTDLQGSVAKFVAGEGLFLVDGNWDAAKIDDGLGEDAGFFAFPGTTTTGIGTSVAYGISSASEHPDVAAAFLDFMQSPAAGQYQWEQGFLPVDGTELAPEEGTVRADLLSAWEAVNDADGLVGFNANASPTMNDTFKASTQEIIGGRLDTRGAIERVQADWTQTHG